MDIFLSGDDQIEGPKYVAVAGEDTSVVSVAYMTMHISLLRLFQLKLH